MSVQDPSEPAPLATNGLASAPFAGWQFERVLGAEGRDLYLLGSIKDEPAILIVQPSALDAQACRDAAFKDIRGLGQNDIYHWMTANFATPQPDVKITLIYPATETHVKKYAMRTYRIVKETPELFRSVVELYINSFDIERIRWVYNILEHKKESERIVYEDPSDEDGFLIVPDMKWDQTTMSTLYLQTIVRPRDIRCVRDLRPKHLPMLRKIRDDAGHAIATKYSLGPGELRMFFHYPPSYYHLHIHIAHVDFIGLAGQTVGQAMMLGDVIDQLELEAASPPHPDGAWYERRTLTYGLDILHGTYAGLSAATIAA